MLVGTGAKMESVVPVFCQQTWRILQASRQEAGTNPQNAGLKDESDQSLDGWHMAGAGQALRQQALSTPHPLSRKTIKNKRCLIRLLAWEECKASWSKLDSQAIWWLSPIGLASTLVSKSHNTENNITLCIQHDRDTTLGNQLLIEHKDNLSILNSDPHSTNPSTHTNKHRHTNTHKHVDTFRSKKQFPRLLLHTSSLLPKVQSSN